LRARLESRTTLIATTQIWGTGLACADHCTATPFFSPIAYLSFIPQKSAHFRYLTNCFREGCAATQPKQDPLHLSVWSDGTPVSRFLDACGVLLKDEIGGEFNKRIKISKY
jgi:hypothetical protein